jgi:hypothetical protein
LRKKTKMVRESARKIDDLIVTSNHLSEMICFMDDQLLLGLWHCVLPIPPKIWQRMVKGDADLGFMSADHHRVRNLVVEEIPRVGRPLSPAWISQKLNIPLPQVGEILDELERNMTFLFRNPDGEVIWAYPVTVDRTPHQVSFSTGEKIYAA